MDPERGTKPGALEDDTAMVGVPASENASAPDAAPFVRVGERIAVGQPIGLIEVMKTFNQIVFEGVDSGESAEVVEICAEDGQEVAAGAPLIRIR